MMKRLRNAVVLCVVLMCFGGTARSAEIVDSGSCGESLSWILYDDGLLKIEGEGDMVNDYSSYQPAPWNEYNQVITEIEFDDKITSIGKSAFCYCENLKKITIPGSVKKYW